MNVLKTGMIHQPLIDFSHIGVAKQRGGFHMDDYWIWCGSVVRGEDKRYHMFASRWPRSLPFHPSWMTHSEIVRAVADFPEGPYRFEEVVLPARGAEYWDGDSTHNPIICKHGDTYLLYYMGSCSPLEPPAPGEPFDIHDPRCIVARSNKRIGLATAPSVFGPWTRLDMPILKTCPGTYYSYLTSNSAPVVHDDGSVLLMFKSREYEGRFCSNMRIGVAKADHWSGPYQVVTSEQIFGSTADNQIEDPFLWRVSNGYGMIAKDMSGRLCGEGYGGIQAWSPDGLHWTLCDPPQSWSRKVRWDDGRIQIMGSCERPFILFEDGRPTHLFLAMADGPGGFTKASQTWNQAIAFT